MSSPDWVPAQVVRYCDLLSLRQSPRDIRRAGIGQILMTDERLRPFYAHSFFAPWGGSTLWSLWADAVIEAAFESEDNRRPQRDQAKRQKVLFARLASALPGIVDLLRELGEIDASSVGVDMPAELDDAAALVEEAGRLAGYVQSGTQTPYNTDFTSSLTTRHIVEALANSVAAHAPAIEAEQSHFARKLDNDILSSQKHAPLRSYVVSFDRAMYLQKAEFRRLTARPPVEVARLPDQLVTLQYFVTTSRAASDPVQFEDDVERLVRQVNTHRLSRDVFC